LDKQVEHLQQTLEAISNKSSHEPAKEVIKIQIQGKEIPLSWDESATKADIQNVIDNFTPFRAWVGRFSDSKNTKDLQVHAIHFQSIDLRSDRVVFAKFQANILNSQGRKVPGVVFMPGPSVGILVILKLEEPGAADHGAEFGIITFQARVPLGKSRFAEIPAGMLEGGDFVGTATRKLRDMTGLIIRDRDLIDLTALAYQENYPGVVPSGGGCDEFCRLFMHRTKVTRGELTRLNDKRIGSPEQGETIMLKVVPLDTLWHQAPEAKSLSALCLYHRLIASGKIPIAF